MKSQKNKDEKEGEKQRAIKNQIEKKINGNKTLSEKGSIKGKNFDKKTIKEKEPNVKVLSHELLASTLLSNASSLVILQSFKSLFTVSSHVKFGLPLSLLSLPVRLITPLRTDAPAGLHWICPNYLKRCCTSFSSTGITPNLSHMSSFRTQSLLVLPQIHRSMHISATLSCWTCHLLIGQHSAPYNIAG
jgi:hypothetical protein